MANNIQLTYNRPFLFPYQIEILNDPARFSVTIASTKVGKTASHIVWLFEEGLKCKKNESVWWVAPTFSQAKIAYNRMKAQINIPNFFKANETNLILTLPTGAKIEFKTGENPENLFGDDVFAFVFDEFTRAREAAWFAIRSTITSTGGRGKFIGNAKGKKNWGYKLAMKAKSGLDKDFKYFKIDAYDAAAAGLKTKDGRPFIDEVEAAKKDLPESVFNELYLAEASEDGSNPFGLNYIALICQPTLSTQPTICRGIDVANKVDFCSIIGLDKLGTMSEYQNFHKIGWPNTIDTIKYLSDLPTTMDSTGVGDVVLSQVEQVQSQVKGYIFTQASKQRLMEGLAIAIQGRKIVIADDGNVVSGTGKLRHQLEQFEFEYTRTGVRYSAPPGEHDDDVCSLALAWDQWKSASLMGDGPSVW